MKRALVHIGMHKTGTSSIQESLAGYDDGTIRYADLKERGHGSVLFTAFEDVNIQNSRNGKQCSLEHAEQKRMTARQCIINDVTKHNASLTIFSAEALLYLSLQGVKDLKEFFDQYFDDIEILAYVREPLSYILSMTQQFIKMGAITTELPSPSYQNSFVKFIDTFGRSKVIFRQYSKENLVGASSVSDFCNFVGIPHESIVHSTVNKRLPFEAVQLLHNLNAQRVFNSKAPPFVKARNAVIDILTDLFNSPFVAALDDLESAIEPDDIRWMEETAGFDLCRADIKPNCHRKGRGLLDRLENISPSTKGTLLGYLDENDILFEEDDTVTQLIMRLFLFQMNRYSLSVQSAFILRDLAIKLEDHSDFTLSQARDVMAIARLIHPQGDFIRRKLVEYEEKLEADLS
ncbi:MAG: hypothetical protein AAF720_11830 [Pseudomonadota bacterium]